MTILVVVGGAAAALLGSYLWWRACFPFAMLLAVNGAPQPWWIHGGLVVPWILWGVVVAWWSWR